MAKYNAAKHTIESDDGRTTLATLSSEITANAAFEIADYWGGHSKAIDEVTAELNRADAALADMRHEARHSQEESRQLRAKLDESRHRIDELEADLGSITGFIQGSDRIDEDTRAAIEALVKEIARARAKFPNNRHMLAALTEEVGELAKALIEEDEEWRTEAIQCACVAIRVATEGDGDFEFTEKGAAAA